MILANADCAKKGFTDAIMRLGSQMFPKYAFRELEPNHVIYTNEQFPAANWKNRPSVLGMTNGVRELMLLVPEADLSRAWHMRNEKVNTEVYQLGADIFVYAIDKKTLKLRGETAPIRAKPDVTAERTVKVARLMVGQNWDPEPGGWRRLGAILHNDYRTDLDVHAVDLAKEKLSGYRVAHLTGTRKFALTQEVRNALVEFVVHGGTLVVDAAGGSREFADAAEVELAQMFGAEAVTKLRTPLPPNSAVYTLPGAPVGPIAYRTFARKVVTGDARSPRVRGIDRAGRVGVFFSREDLSAGMVGQPVDGIVGYAPDTATSIMRNIILYAAPHK